MLEICKKKKSRKHYSRTILVSLTIKVNQTRASQESNLMLPNSMVKELQTDRSLTSSAKCSRTSTQIQITISSNLMTTVMVKKIKVAVVGAEN